MSQPHGEYGAYYGAPPGVKTTPDGAVLAGWWRRVSASLIDGIVLLVVNVAVGFTWWSNIVDAYVDYYERATEAAEAGRPAPSQMDVQEHVAGDLIALTVVGVVIGFLYYAGFLMWKQATIGKLLVGTRVRLRETPDLPFGAVVKRWLAQSAVGLLGMIPFVGCLVSLYLLLDSLWPLWDDKKQALHDKFAGTNVVLK